MSWSLSNSPTCDGFPNDDPCGGCGWKCDCVSCTTNAGNSSIECHCSCRFWIVVCVIVAIGFLGVFFTSVIYKRLLLSFMSSMAVVMAAAFASLSILTDGCVWPAFFAVILVFAFPCFYSCCWNYHSRRAGIPVPGGVVMTHTVQEEQDEADRDKPPPAVIIQSPGGEFQIGMEVEMEDLNLENGGVLPISDEPTAESSTHSCVQLGESVDSRRPLNRG